MAWCDTGRTARIWGGIDARSLFPFIVFVFIPNKYTFFACVLTAAFFWILDKKNLSYMMAFRRLRTIFSGNRKYSRPWWKDRPFGTW